MRVPAAWLIAGSGVFALLAGCGGGGGGGGSSAPPVSRTSNARARIIATTRVSRAIMAVSGMGRTITRYATPPAPKSWGMGARIPLIFQLASAPGRAAPLSPAPPAAALDPGTGLYYTTAVNPDGSGEELLFLDPATTQPAGSFMWSRPKWATILPNTYPATITVTYNITAGNFAGVQGTMQVTVNDPQFKTGLITMVLTDSQHESAKANLSLSAEGVSAQNQITLGDGDSCEETDITTAAGVLDQVCNWPDGGSDTIDTSPDGNSTETYTNPDGTAATPDLSGSVQPDGTDTLDDGSGGTTTVNVDPGSDDSGDDGGTDGGTGGGTDSSRKATLPGAPAPVRRGGKLTGR